MPPLNDIELIDGTKKYAPTIVSAYCITKLYAY